MLRSSNVTSYIYIIVCGSLLIYGKDISESCIRNASGIIIESTFYTLPLFNGSTADGAREFCKLAGSTVTNFRSAEFRRLLQPFLYEHSQKENSSVLTGLRSERNQTKWYWNGEFESTELGLANSDPFTCEELSWQLEVFNDFTTSVVECSNIGNISFSCEYPITFYLHQLSCLSTALRLSLTFEGIRNFKSNIEFTARVFLESGRSLRNDTFHLNEFGFLIGQLREDAFYSVQIFSNICFENRITTLTNRTSRGVPEAVTNARVLEHEYGTNNCIIAWYHDYFRDRGISVYKIIATNNLGLRQDILVSTSTNPSLEDRVNQQHSYKVILNEDLLNTNILFTIQGITCEFEGQLTSVRGSCVVFDNERTRLNVSPRESVSIFIIISIIFTIAFLVSLACKTKREKRGKEQKRKTRKEKKQKKKSRRKRPSSRDTENYYDQSVYSIDENKAIEADYYEHYENQHDFMYENTNGKRGTSLAVKLSEKENDDEEYETPLT